VDGGDTWVLKKQLSIEGDPQTKVHSLLYNPVNHWIFAGTENDSQIWVSKDGGETWALDQDLEYTYAYCLAYDAQHLRNLAGVVSGGRIWTRGNE
jgi:photosystem II stability/assembly factor-like uncharacterized protein